MSLNSLLQDCANLHLAATGNSIPTLLPLAGAQASGSTTSRAPCPACPTEPFIAGAASESSPMSESRLRSS